MAFLRGCPLALALALALALSASFRPCAADTRMPSTNPGLFYVFMSGQVVVLDAATVTVVKSIRNLNGNPAQIPNGCPGNPLQGSWNDVAMGNMGNTILASMSFAAQGPMRDPTLSDGVLVLNTTSLAFDSIIRIDGQPSALTPVPQDGSVWVHTDTAGTFTVFSISPTYEVQKVNLGLNTNVAAPGSLVTDTAMGSKGYMTTVAGSGVYTYDIFARNGATNFTNFQTFSTAHHSWLRKRGVYCPATNQGVYAPASRRVFVSCMRRPDANGGLVTGGTDPGIVEISTDSDEPVDAWPHVLADRLYMTPDESLVVAVDKKNAIVNLVQPLPGINSDQTMSSLWTNITLLPGSQPDNLIFFPSGQYYKAFVSLLRSTYTAVIDFNVIIPCGMYCDGNIVQSAVSYVNSGLQIKTGAINSAVTTRAIAAGHKFFCVDNAVNGSLYCHNMEKPQNSKWFHNMQDIQKIVFVEGRFPGNEKLIPSFTNGAGINTTFSC